VKANGGGGFEAVHFGHLDVHEDEIEVLQGEKFHGFFSGLGNRDGVTVFFEEADGQELIDSVVFGEKDFKGRELLAGRARSNKHGDGSAMLPGAHDGLDGVEEIGAANRLGETGAHAQFPAASNVATKPTGGEHDDGGRREIGIGAEAFDESEAVHLWHVSVKKNKRERRGRITGAEKTEGLWSAVSESGFQAPGEESLFEDAAIGGVVVDDEDG